MYDAKIAEMKLLYQVHEKYKYMEAKLLEVPDGFGQRGCVLKQGRNEIRVIEVEGLRLNVKSYKIPNVLNRIVYAWVRLPKARRSYLHALRLTNLGIGTPEAVAWVVYRNRWGITRSFYISRHVDFDYEFRDLKDARPADLEELLKAFTRYTYALHCHSIYFLDHSPGNTLITRDGDGYRFQLVDLNRMRFMRMSPYKGLRNFYRLNADAEMIRVIAREYARLTNEEPERMTHLLSRWTMRHDARVKRRRARKNKSLRC